MKKKTFSGPKEEYVKMEMEGDSGEMKGNLSRTKKKIAKRFSMIGREGTVRRREGNRDIVIESLSLLRAYFASLHAGFRYIYIYFLTPIWPLFLFFFLSSTLLPLEVRNFYYISKSLQIKCEFEIFFFETLKIFNIRIENFFLHIFFRF